MFRDNGFVLETNLTLYSTHAQVESVRQCRTMDGDKKMEDNRGWRTMQNNGCRMQLEDGNKNMEDNRGWRTIEDVDKKMPLEESVRKHEVT